MIIGICSFGGTGSGAAKDLLKEYTETQVLDRAECQFAFKVDGLQDLEYHLVKKNSRQMAGDVAIKRFLECANYAHTPFVKKIYKNKQDYLNITHSYAKSLIQATWMGLDNYDFETGNTMRSIVVLGFKKIIIPKYERITGRLFPFWPMRKMYLSISPDNFYNKTKKYTKNLILASGGDFSKKIVLDQPFEGDHPEQSFPFFDDPIAVVVDRDPRDLYIASSYQWPDGTFMPRRDPIAFVEYYKRLRQQIVPNEKVLRVSLEDMIFNYDNTIDQIERFLSLNPNNHKYKYKYFNPEYSIKGVQVFQKIKGHEEEVKYIEKELSDYIFPFEKYEKAKNNNEIVLIP